MAGCRVVLGAARLPGGWSRGCGLRSLSKIVSRAISVTGCKSPQPAPLPPSPSQPVSIPEKTPVSCALVFLTAILAEANFSSCFR